MNKKSSGDIAVDINTVISDVVNAVIGPFNMRELLGQIINTTMNILHAEVCSIFLEDKDDEPGVFKCVAGSGFAENIVGKAKYRYGEGFTGSVAQYGGEYNIKSRKELEDLEIAGNKVWEGVFDPNQWPSGESEFRNLLALPLKIKEQIIGVLKVENKIKRYGKNFTVEDLIILKTIANVISLAIEKTKLQLRVENQLKKISAMAGHRILNYMTRFDGIARKIKRVIKSDSISKDDLYIILKQMEAATSDTKILIEEFRTYGAPTKLQKKITDINEVIQNEIWLAKPPEEISIIADLDEKLPEIEIDAPRFSESIKEIVSNAKRAILNNQSHGNIRVMTKMIKHRGDAKQYILIIIKDDGPGFSPDIHIFEPFQSTDPQRTGLGLATVKENLEAHGGSIKATHDADLKGACFELYLPITGGETC